MFCANCGKKNLDKATFCIYCGMKLTQVPEMKAPVGGEFHYEEPAPYGSPAPQPEMPPQKRGGSGVKIAAAVIAGVALCAGIGVFAWHSLSSDGKEELPTKEAALETESSSVEAGLESAAEISEEAGEEQLVQGEGQIIDVASLSSARPSFLSLETTTFGSECVSNVAPYAVDATWSNVTNQDRFYLSDSAMQKLQENLFVVSGEYQKEFFSLYEENRYFQLPNFVTVDSLMHTYHLYFSYLLQNTEKSYLAGTLSALSQNMLSQSQAQLEQLKGTEWESAASRNVAFFAVGAYLQDSGISVPAEVQSQVTEEVNRIMAADGILESTLTGVNEDYSQYKPRGYYEGDELLEQYFRAMMWYGRIGFEQKEEDLDRSSLLMTLAIRDVGVDSWESIYLVTSFFAGSSDDLLYFEYLPLIEEVYGSGVSVEQLVGDTEKWSVFHQATAQLRPPAINSTPIEDGEENIILGYRFMGQRFTVDADIMQQLIYSATGANSAGENRMLPDVLDVPAALGSDVALELLAAQGDTDYAGYMENMTELREEYSSAPEDIWTASLYANWLNTLRPLLEEKGDGYPSFMQSQAWAIKSLETFAGSYTELKHDTVLYSKQVMAEMGGMDVETYDDRGYVQPEPAVYERFAFLAEQTAAGLQKYGMLSEADAENLQRLTELAQQLEVISEKELRSEGLSDQEYELIRNYGGTLEHFWSDAMKGITSLEDIYPEEYPCPLVVDVATDPNGSVLELATGGAATMYVIVPVDGTLRIASGTVYSFYQFEWPLSDRMTDTEWRQMMGYELNENNEYSRENAISQPEWTQSYRVANEW